MKAIIISDYFDEEVEKYLKQYCKPNYNKSGLNYQESLFNGFETLLGQGNVKMFCCPTCGTFPNESSLISYPKFDSQDPDIEYIGFNNVIYIRNIFRYLGLKKRIKKYLLSLPKDEEIFVLVIQMHYPFMKSLRYIRRFFPKATSCINIWDFPNYVDFRNNGPIKRYLKSINYKKTVKMLVDYDLYFYLCEGMHEKNPFKKNYIVHEGIITHRQIQDYNEELRIAKQENKQGTFRIVYTGRLTTQDGVIDLIDAINQINDGSIVLEIAGGGEIEGRIVELKQRYKWLVFHGQLNRKDVIKLQCKADLFVLPRLPEEYTNYSFPSKMIEYMLARKPILAHPLNCFSQEVRDKLFLIDEETNDKLPEVLYKTIRAIKNLKEADVDYSSFLDKNLDLNIAREITELSVGNKNV